MPKVDGLKTGHGWLKVFVGTKRIRIYPMVGIDFIADSANQDRILDVS
jgi:hypothetical protein